MSRRAQLNIEDLREFAKDVDNKHKIKVDKLYSRRKTQIKTARKKIESIIEYDTAENRYKKR